MISTRLTRMDLEFDRWVVAFDVATSGEVTRGSFLERG
jgi:hypothetical protein